LGNEERDGKRDWGMEKLGADFKRGNKGGEGKKQRGEEGRENREYSF